MSTATLLSLSVFPPDWDAAPDATVLLVSDDVGLDESVVLVDAMEVKEGVVAGCPGDGTEDTGALPLLVIDGTTGAAVGRGEVETVTSGVAGTEFVVTTDFVEGTASVVEVSMESGVVVIGGVTLSTTSDRRGITEPAVGS